MRKFWLGVVSAVGLLGLAGFLLARPESSVGERYDVVPASPAQLGTVSELTIFFGHQSVGRNLLAALPQVYSAEGLVAPQVVESEEPLVGPVFQHTNIHQNQDPLGKIAAFDRILRDGVADAVDVAVLKLCYVDFHEGDDIDHLFETYRSTLAALERDYPRVTFVHTTVPLTTDRGVRGRAEDRINRLLGRGTRLGVEHNVVREQYNAKLREVYGNSGQLFDLAAIQSTQPDGTRLKGSLGGQTFYSMAREHASDSGHLNPDGAAIAVSALLATIARAVDQPPA